MTTIDDEFATARSRREAPIVKNGPGGPAAVPGQSTAPGSYAAFMQNRHFGSMNGVRCLCCLGVIKEHVNLRFPAVRFFDNGSLGVDMFFIISGFLIVTLLLRERAKNGFVDLKKFYVRRALRIFPVAYLTIFAVIAFYLAISPWKPNGLTFYLATLPVLLTYTVDFIGDSPGLFWPYWSLAMEEQFYQVWPVIEKFWAGWRVWVVLGLVLLLNQGVNFGFFDRLITWIYGRPEQVRRGSFYDHVHAHLARGASCPSFECAAAVPVHGRIGGAPGVTLCHPGDADRLQ